MKTFYRIILLILLLYGCGSNTSIPDLLVKHKPNQKLRTYEWSVYSLKNVPRLNEVNLKLEGDGLVRKYDSMFSVLALDTTLLYLTIKSPEINQTDTLMAVQNPDFNPEWEKLGFGETPTPLTKDEFRVFAVFNEYRLLNKPLPIFQMESVDSVLLDNSSFNGKVSVLEFWYAGCKPCETLIPSLDKLKEKYQNNSNIQWISLFKDSIYVNPDGELLFQSSSFSSEGSPPRKYDFHWKQFPNAWSKNRVFNIMAYPTTMILDTSGVVRAIHVGASESGDNEELINALSNQIDNLKITD